MLYHLNLEIDRQRAQRRFDQLMDERTKIELKKKVKRTLRQNSYLHLLIGYFSLETGYNLIEAKQIYKEQSPDIYEYEKNGKKFIRSSAELNTGEMTVTIDRFKAYSASEAGINLPDAEDKNFLDEIQRELQRNSFI